MNNDKVYIVEVKTGSTYEGDAMLFDSVWTTKELAEKHCEKFKTSGGCYQTWPYTITETNLNQG